nr:MAG TPA: hypothetical protein [Caudoviricetes sp.]
MVVCNEFFISLKKIHSYPIARKPLNATNALGLHGCPVKSHCINALIAFDIYSFFYFCIHLLSVKFFHSQIYQRIHHPLASYESYCISDILVELHINYRLFLLQKPIYRIHIHNYHK